MHQICYSPCISITFCLTFRLLGGDATGSRNDAICSKGSLFFGTIGTVGGFFFTTGGGGGGGVLGRNLSSLGGAFHSEVGALGAAVYGIG